MRKKSMNKAVKSLSLALALSMGLTLLPGIGAVEAEAAAKSGVVLHGKKKVFSAKKGTSAYIGEKKINLDLLFKGKNISKKVKWSSSKGSVISVNKKNGVLTAKSNGSSVITAVYKNKKYKALVKVFTRAESMAVEDNGMTVTEVNLTEGESKNLNISYKLSDKVVAAGGVSSTYNSYVKGDGTDTITLAKDKASSQVFTVTANKAGESYIDIVGSQRSAAKADADKKRVTARIKVKVTAKVTENTDKLEGKQTGAMKITVTGKNLTSNVKDYSVKIGNNTREIANVTVNSTGTEAVLNMKANVTDGDYTVEFGGKASSFKGETEKFVKIDVPSKYLVLKGDNSSSGGTIEYNVTNQFGEDVTKKAGGVSVTVSAGTAVANSATGLIDVTNLQANLPLKTPVVVTIVRNEGANLISGTFNVEIAAKSKASSVTVKGIYNNETKQPYKLAVNNANENAKARLLIEVKDQYGRKMNSTEGVVITSNPGLAGISVDTGVHSTLMTVDGIDYVAIPLKGTDTAKAGTSTVLFVASNGTGVNNVVTANIEVAGTKQVNKITVTASAEVYAGEITYFNYSAVNDSGQAITDYATLSSDKYGVKLPEAFAWENVANGTAKLKYDSSKDPVVKNINWSSGAGQVMTSAVFTVASNMQPFLASFNVLAPAVPSSIRDLSVDGVLAGGITENVIPKVKIADNKGRDLEDLSMMSGYYLGIKKLSTGTRFTAETVGASVGTGDSGVKLFKLSELKSGELKFKASALAITGYETEEFEFAIYKDLTGTNKVAGSNKTVRVTAADLKNLTSFSVNLPSAVYSTTSSSEYDNVKVVVVGKASDGSSVKLGDTDFTITDPENISNNTTKTLKPSIIVEKAKKGDVTDNVRVVISNDSGTDITKTVTVSAKSPTVTKVEAKVSELLASDINNNGAKAIRDALIITDNYTAEANGVNPSTEAAKQTIQGIRLVSSASGNVKATLNNTVNVTFSGAVPKDMITVEVTFASGVKGTFNFKLN